jgi:hypothetical protein
MSLIKNVPIDLLINYALNLTLFYYSLCRFEFILKKAMLRNARYLLFLKRVLIQFSNR